MRRILHGKNIAQQYAHYTHRLPGLFHPTGIMAVYSLNSIVLIFRDTDFLKEKQIVKELKPGLEAGTGAGG